MGNCSIGQAGDLEANYNSQVSLGESPGHLIIFLFKLSLDCLIIAVRFGMPHKLWLGNSIPNAFVKERAFREDFGMVANSR